MKKKFWRNSGISDLTATFSLEQLIHHRYKTRIKTWGLIAWLKASISCQTKTFFFFFLNILTFKFLYSVSQQKQQSFPTAEEQNF